MSEASLLNVDEVILPYVQLPAPFIMGLWFNQEPMIKGAGNFNAVTQGGDTPVLPLIPSATGHHESLTVYY